MRTSFLYIAVLGIIGFLVYLLYQASTASNQYQTQLQIIRAQQAYDSDRWLTVPGAIGAGIDSAGSLITKLSNLFSSTPSATPTA